MKGYDRARQKLEGASVISEQLTTEEGDSYISELAEELYNGNFPGFQQELAKLHPVEARAVINDPEIQGEAMSIFWSDISNGDIGGAKMIAEYFFSDNPEVLRSEDSIDLTLRILPHIFSDTDESIQEIEWLVEYILRDEQVGEAKEAALGALKKVCENLEVDERYAKRASDLYNLFLHDVGEEALPILEQPFVGFLSSSNVDLWGVVDLWKVLYSTIPGFLERPAVAQATKDFFIARFGSPEISVDSVIELFFKDYPERLRDPEIKQVIQRRLEHALLKGVSQHGTGFDKYVEAVIFEDPEMIIAAHESMVTAAAQSIDQLDKAEHMDGADNSGEFAVESDEVNVAGANLSRKVLNSFEAVQLLLLKSDAFLSDDSRDFNQRVYRRQELDLAYKAFVSCAKYAHKGKLRSFFDEYELSDELDKPHPDIKDALVSLFSRTFGSHPREVADDLQAFLQINPRDYNQEDFEVNMLEDGGNVEIEDEAEYSKQSTAEGSYTVEEEILIAAFVSRIKDGVTSNDPHKIYDTLLNMQNGCCQQLSEVCLGASEVKSALEAALVMNFSQGDFLQVFRVLTAIGAQGVELSARLSIKDGFAENLDLYLWKTLQEGETSAKQVKHTLTKLVNDYFPDQGARVDEAIAGVIRKAFEETQNSYDSVRDAYDLSRMMPGEMVSAVDVNELSYHRLLAELRKDPFDFGTVVFCFEISEEKVSLSSKPEVREAAKAAFEAVLLNADGNVFSRALPFLTQRLLVGEEEWMLEKAKEPFRRRIEKGTCVDLFSDSGLVVIECLNKWQPGIFEEGVFFRSLLEVLDADLRKGILPDLMSREYLERLWGLTDNASAVDGRVKEVMIRLATLDASEGNASHVSHVFERYISEPEDSEPGKMISTIYLRALLNKGSLARLQGVGKEDRADSKFLQQYPDLIRELTTTVDFLREGAREIGVHLQSAASGQYNVEEWHAMVSFLMEDGIRSKETLQVEDVRAVRDKIMEMYAKKQPSAIAEPYTLLVDYLRTGVKEKVDNDSKVEDEGRLQDLVWGYMGGSDKHHILEPVKRFVEVAREIEGVDGKSRVDVVRTLLTRAGMGSGLQAETCKKIMGSLDRETWNFLETDTMYPGQEPALSDKDNLNLLNIANEITLYKSPEIREMLIKLPPEKIALRKYVSDLLQVPSINVDAIKHFLAAPNKFFASRTGAGESTGYVATALTELSPDRYPHWSTELSRDAIVEGSYDRINSFKPVEAVWHGDAAINGLREVLKYPEHTQDGSIDADFSRNVLMDIMKRARDENSSLERRMDDFLHTTFFVEYVVASEQGYSSMIDWLSEKGKVFSEKAAQYAVKQEKGEVEAEIKKYSKSIDKFEKQLSNPKLPEDRREEFTKQLDHQRHLLDALEARKNEVDARAADLQNKLSDAIDTALAAESPEEQRDKMIDFWTLIRETGFKVNAVHMVKQMTGEEFADPEEFFGHAIDKTKSSSLLRIANELLDQIEDEADLEWYKAEVLKPSDTKGAYAGTISGTCDAFGHGKRAHFMANPGCAQFVLQHSRGKKPKEWDNGKIIAQSLLTDNKNVFDAPEQRWDFVKKLTEHGGNMETALRECGFEGGVPDFLERYANAPQLLVLDSVEVPRNVQSKFSSEALFKKLGEAFDLMGQVDQMYAGKEVRLGTQYSYINGDQFPSAPNTDMWVTPLAYSDNFGMESHRDTSIVLREAAEAGVSPGKNDTVEDEVSQKEKKMISKVRPAKPQDAFAIGMMEDIGFRRSGGERYITGMLAMTRNLYTSVLQSTHFETAPLAFVEEANDSDGNKEYRGYLIAQIRTNGDIYIEDTATTGTAKGVGTRLMGSLLMEAARDPVLSKKSIVMDCRGTTSALAITKEGSVAVLEALGYRLEGPSHEEVAKYKSDSLIPYRLTPIRA